jgi:hypothetical protein
MLWNFGSFLSRIAGRASSGSRSGPRRQRGTALRVEQLEDRNMPSVYWTGWDGNSQWNDALNWIDDSTMQQRVPGASDDAVIGLYSMPIVNDFEAVRTLTGSGGVKIVSNGSLTINVSAEIASVDLEDGSALAGHFTSSVMIGSLTVNGNANLSVPTTVGNLYSDAPGSGTLNVASSLTIIGHIIEPNITVLGVSGASLQLIGGPEQYGVTVIDGTIDNRAGLGTGGGSFITGDGSIFLIYGGITNELGAQFTIGDTAPMGGDTSFESGVFNNQGTLVITQSALNYLEIWDLHAGTGNPLTHSAIDVDGGTLVVGTSDGYTGLLSGAVSVQSGSTLGINGDFRFSALSASGDVEQYGGAVIVDSTLGPVTFSNYLLSGSSMEILPGSVLSISQSFITGTNYNVTLIFDIGPSSSPPLGTNGRISTQFGTVSLSVNTTVIADLVGGFVPTVSQDFRLITAQSLITPGGLETVLVPPGFTYQQTNTSLDALFSP